MLSTSKRMSRIKNNLSREFSNVQQKSGRMYSDNEAFVVFLAFLTMKECREIDVKPSFKPYRNA